MLDSGHPMMTRFRLWLNHYVNWRWIGVCPSIIRYIYIYISIYKIYIYRERERENTVFLFRPPLLLLNSFQISRHLLSRPSSWTLGRAHRAWPGSGGFRSFLAALRGVRVTQKSDKAPAPKPKPNAATATTTTGATTETTGLPLPISRRQHGAALSMGLPIKARNLEVLS